MYWTHHYIIDWTKVNTLEDIKKILEVTIPPLECTLDGVGKIQEFLIEKPKDMGTTSSLSIMD